MEGHARACDRRLRTLDAGAAPTKRFDKSFTQQEPIPETGIVRAVEVMRSGRLHRYNVAPGEESETSAFEREYAAYQGVDYCVACASGGSAIHIALRSVGLKPGDRILANAHTLAPVPGAIHNAGGVPVLVETDDRFHVDLDDLRAKAKDHGARFLLLSHMRGHIADMDAVTAICHEFDIALIEDCAHTMGARWRGERSGNFGSIACFSTQTYKHLNCGEGGLITTNDALAAASAVMHCGSYMLYDRHGAAPDAETFNEIRLHTPNYSGRMDNLRAAILRPQLTELDRNIERWNALYRVLDRELRAVSALSLPRREPHEQFVGSSIQFVTEGITQERIPAFLAACSDRGVEIKWFGDDEPKAYTSRYDSWRYWRDLPVLPKTLAILSKTCDMRIPLTFDEKDCAMIAGIIAEEAARATG
ncbi:MAG: aminotransferase [Phycisphaeraceae bacterium]|nr:aminotransferase [Phycisphaeraceae bacterium]